MIFVSTIIARLERGALEEGLPIESGRVLVLAPMGDPLPIHSDQYDAMIEMRSTIGKLGGAEALQQGPESASGSGPGMR
jgi:hypothetical protein